MSETADNDAQSVDVKPFPLKGVLYVENLPNRPVSYIQDEYKSIELGSTDTSIPIDVLSELDPCPIVVAMGILPEKNEEEMIGATEISNYDNIIAFYNQCRRPLPEVSLGLDSSADIVLKSANIHPSWCARNTGFITPIPFVY